LRRYAPIRDIIANEILRGNTRHLTLGLLEANGAINAAPNHPADKLTNKSEKIINQIESTFNTN